MCAATYDTRGTREYCKWFFGLSTLYNSRVALTSLDCSELKHVQRTDAFLVDWETAIKAKWGKQFQQHFMSWQLMHDNSHLLQGTLAHAEDFMSTCHPPSQDGVCARVDARLHV